MKSLHVTALIHHPQRDITQRHIKPTHPINTHTVLTINNGSHKHKDVDTMDNVTLTHSLIKSSDVPLSIL
jgi:hypothetical protein